jgi:hypothetical protein
VSSQSLLGQLNYVLDLFVNYRAGKTDTLAAWVGVDDTAKAGRSKGFSRFRGQTDSVSERNCCIIGAGSSNGSVEGRFSRPLATSD